MKMIIEHIREQPNVVGRQMISLNEYERLRQLLRERLADCGWRDQVTKLCKVVLAENDIEELSAVDIIDKVTPKARSLVPATVKKELLQKIKNSLMESSGLMTNNSQP